MPKIMSAETVGELMSRKRWVYWLQETKRDPDNKNRFLVCIVVEDEPGFFPMLGRGLGASPWYWDKETCRAQNEKRGYSEEDAFDIVTSSMAAGPVIA